MQRIFILAGLERARRRSLPEAMAKRAIDRAIRDAMSPVHPPGCHGGRCRVNHGATDKETKVFGLLRRNRHERAGFMLYNIAVIAARDPHYYRELGVADTLDGRFDLVGLYACLLIHRLRLMPAPGPALAQAVFDAMFSDMDLNLRELGVSDLSVGKRVKAMWEAFHGRAAVYEAAFAAGDVPGLANALRRNVWRGALHESVPGDDDAATDLARIAMAQDAHLAGQGLESLAKGVVSFLPAARAA